MQNFGVELLKQPRLFGMDMISGMRERISRTKSDKKLISQNKNNLISEEKQNEAKQIMQRQSITTSYYQTDVQPISKQCLPSKNYPCFRPSLLSTFYCPAWCYMVLSIPLVHLSKLSWLCPTPASCPPPAKYLQGYGE